MFACIFLLGPNHLLEFEALYHESFNYTNLMKNLLGVHIIFDNKKQKNGKQEIYYAIQNRVFFSQKGPAEFTA